MLIGLHLMIAVSVDLRWNVTVYGVQRGCLLCGVWGDDYSVVRVAARSLIVISESRKTPLRNGHLQVLMGLLVKTFLILTVLVFVNNTQMLLTMGIQVVFLVFTFAGRLAADPFIVRAFNHHTLARTGLWA